MAESLKSQYGPEVPRRLARELRAVWPEFPEEAFLKTALHGYEELELMPRGHHLARALVRWLPSDFSSAIEILLASLGSKQPSALGEGGGLNGFFYLPHALFVAKAGLGERDFEVAMKAHHAITQHFTAEFSVRPFLEKYPGRMLQQLDLWAADPSEDVRRLVSEGTRPRLPWAARLRVFEENPEPILRLLEKLRDDPSVYVRRSVANHLNDIGKDAPEVLIALAKGWLSGVDVPTARKWVVRHALRSRIKAGDPQALALLGFASTQALRVCEISTEPRKVRIGGRVDLAFCIENRAEHSQNLLVDLRVHYVKANGRSNPKVFKLKTVNAVAKERVFFKKKLSFADLSTRRHYPGEHRVEALVNGSAYPLGTFLLAF